MEPFYESSDDGAEDMAKAMGFSSFGAKNPAKKRKFNPKTDAVVEGQALESLDKGGKKGQGSGGNQIPLGKPRVFGVKAAPGNADEIDVDGEDDDEDTPAYVDTSLPAPAEACLDRGEGISAYLDAKKLPPNEESRAAQERIDAILAGRSVVPQQAIKGKDRQSSGVGLGQFMTALYQPLPPKPQASIPSRAAEATITGNQRPRERGLRNEFWYIGYYDPSFNENPWAKLEKENGLPPGGTWAERSKTS